MHGYLKERKKIFWGVAPRAGALSLNCYCRFFPDLSYTREKEGNKGWTLGTKPISSP